MEAPSRLEEQAWGAQRPWVWAGWSQHHRWLVDRTDGGLEFVLKPGLLQGRPEFAFPGAFFQDALGLT